MRDQETGSLEEGQLTYWDIPADGGGGELCRNLKEFEAGHRGGWENGTLSNALKPSGPRTPAFPSITTVGQLVSWKEGGGSL